MYQRVAIVIDSNVYFKWTQTVTGNTDFLDATAYSVGKVVRAVRTLAAGAVATAAGFAVAVSAQNFADDILALFDLNGLNGRSNSSMLG